MGLQRFLPRNMITDFLANEIDQDPLISDFLKPEIIYLMDGVTPVLKKDVSILRYLEMNFYFIKIIIFYYY